MPPDKECIRLFERELEICDSIFHQALQYYAFQVMALSHTSKAMYQVFKFTLDLIISFINMTQLIEKNLIVALNLLGLKTHSYDFGKRSGE